MRILQAHRASGSRATKMRTGGDRGCLVLVRCKYNLDSRERGRYMANYRRWTRLLNCIADA